MEKVCIALWRAADAPAVDVEELLPLVTSTSVRAATLHVECPEQASLRYGAAGDGRLLTALASLWLDTYQDADPITPPASVTWHSWLVSESVPRPYGDAFTWAEGTRSSGLSLVTLIDKPAELEETEFYRYWHELHRVTTAECHPFTSYVRNEVVRPLTPGAPRMRGIVAESAPDVQDFLDPHRFYRSGGDDEQLRVNRRRALQEVMSFIDMDTIQAAPMSEYVVRRLAPTSP